MILDQILQRIEDLVVELESHREQMKAGRVSAYNTLFDIMKVLQVAHVKQLEATILVLAETMSGFGAWHTNILSICVCVWLCAFV